MGKKNKYKQQESKPVVSAPTQPQVNDQLGQDPATSSGDVGSSGRQQHQGSQGGQGGGGQQAGRQGQPHGQAQPWSTQPQQQRPQGQHGSFRQGGPGGRDQQLRQQLRCQQGGHQQRPPQGQRGVYQSSRPPQQQEQQGQYGQQGQGQGSYQSRGPPQQQVALPSQPAGSIKRGTIGKSGQVAVNYLEVDMKKMPEMAFHYDVNIKPERPKKFYRLAFEQFRVDQLGGLEVSFDGKASCFSVVKLPTDSQNPEVIVKDSHGRCLRYTVEIKETADSVINFSSLKSYMSKSISEKPMREMQCLEVVLASPCHGKAIRAGRSFYPTSAMGDQMELGGGYEAKVGLFQSIVLGDRPLLNVDISHKSFPIAMPVLKWFQEYGPSEEKLDEKSRFFIESFLKGLNVVYKPPKSFAATPRCYKVNGLSRFPASSERFQLNGKETTVADYFKDRNYKLEFPQLHCLHVGPPAKKIMLPIELCDIEAGQVLKRKDGDAQVAKMIRFAATPTEKRKVKIMNLLKFFQHNLDPTISRFGIRISNDFIVVNTRTLLPPQVEYQGSRCCVVKNGSWNMVNMRFLEPKPKAHKWAILYFESQRGFRMHYNQVDDFKQRVLAESKKVNVSLEDTAKILAFKDEHSLDGCFEYLKSNCDLAFVILPQFGVTYAAIKQKAELQHGILTQCIKQDTVIKKLYPQTIANILLKVNFKLNGINHKLNDVSGLQMLDNVMFLGADVTHPSPDQRDIPSVVGVVASHDPYGTSYNDIYRLQPSNLELIEDMDSITMEHLRVYQKYRNAYPDHIIYYRDGVDDGQFPKIKRDELGGINAACRRIGIAPKICCIIVVKRHHTRFFPTPKQTQTSRLDYNNVEPGTVVDRTIVHPNDVQFFMVSHSSIGTARPTRYNVIENTGDLDIDLIQQLTYNLCHMYPRCNRSVSYPAPAYLAHHAAKRARVYQTGTKTFKDRQVVPNFKENYPMYFI